MVNKRKLLIALIPALALSLSASLIITGFPVNGQAVHEITVSPTITNTIATYSISSNSPLGIFNVIAITFPAGTEIRGVRTADILFDNLPVKASETFPEENTLVFAPKILHSGNSPWTVTIANIRNPARAGSYTLIINSPIPSQINPEYFAYKIYSPDITPVADRISVSTTVNTPLTIRLTGTDIDSDELIYTILEMPRHGTLSELTGDTVIYTPETDYAGRDYFPFQISDGTNVSGSALVNILITEPTETTTMTTMTTMTTTTTTTTSTTSQPTDSTTTQPPPTTTQPPSTSTETTVTVTQPTPTTTSTQTTTPNGGFFSSCSTNKSNTPSSMTDGFVLGGIGIVLTGGYFAVRNRKKK